MVDFIDFQSAYLIMEAADNNEFIYTSIELRSIIRAIKESKRISEDQFQELFEPVETEFETKPKFKHDFTQLLDVSKPLDEDEVPF